MALKESKRSSYPFAAYKHPALKAALQELFGLRCGYCEANYSVTGNLEVEHYRPKSHYYWLAAEWSNLLPSCNKCNNGKRARFPLQDQRKRAKRRGAERHEVPLLLDPSDRRSARRPERHLAFDSTSGAIQAQLIGGRPSPFALESILVYRLSRKELADARRDWSTRVRGIIAFTRTARKAADRHLAEENLMALVSNDAPFRSLTLSIFRQNGFRFPKTRRGGRP